MSGVGRGRDADRWDAEIQLFTEVLDKTPLPVAPLVRYFHRRSQRARHSALEAVVVARAARRAKVDQDCAGRPVDDSSPFSSDSALLRIAEWCANADLALSNALSPPPTTKGTPEETARIAGAVLQMAEVHAHLKNAVLLTDFNARINALQPSLQAIVDALQEPEITTQVMVRSYATLLSVEEEVWRLARGHGAEMAGRVAAYLRDGFVGLVDSIERRVVAELAGLRVDADVDLLVLPAPCLDGEPAKAVRDTAVRLRALGNQLRQNMDNPLAEAMAMWGAGYVDHVAMRLEALLV